MNYKVSVFGVRESEIEPLNLMDIYDYELALYSRPLSQENIDEVSGSDAVLIRENSLLSKEILDKLLEFGIKHIFTRTNVISNIDLLAAQSNGQLVSFVPENNDQALANLAFTLGLNLVFQVNKFSNQTAKKDFSIPNVLPKSIDSLNVLVIGDEKRAVIEKELWKNIGANLLLGDEVEQADIISLQTEKNNQVIINLDFIERTKENVYITNVSNSNLVDQKYLIKALENNRIAGLATDVVDNQPEHLEAFASLYPKVVMTPRIGQLNQAIIKNQIKVSFENINEIIKTGKSKNLITLRLL